MNTHDDRDFARHMPVPPGMHGLRDEPWTPVGPGGLPAWSLKLPGPPPQVTAAAGAYNTAAPVPVTARTHAQVTSLFGGLPLVAPGVVPVSEWRPDAGEVPGPGDLYAGAARIPQGHR